MATLLRTSGAVEPLTPRNGRSFALAELQALVGGYLEAIQNYGGAAGEEVMFFNEEGKLKGLRRNLEATVRVRHRLQPGDVIVGDAVVCSLLEAGEGEDD